MRILHICQRDDPDTGGSLRVAEALVREQRAAGLEAWMLFLYGEPAEVSTSLGSDTVCLGLRSSRDALGGIGALHKAIRRIDPDIVHSHDGILWPRLAFLFERTPLVMHAHLSLSEGTRLKDRMGRILVKATTRSLIGISEHTIETWVKGKYPPSKMYHVPNGVDFDRFFRLDAPAKAKLRQQLGLPADKRLLLWVGRVHREMKGADRVERVAGLLSPDMALVVVGNGPDLKDLQQSCAEQVADGRVFFVGSTPVPEKYYQAADEFLFTSYYEPFGLVLLEAVASGLPILAFKVTRGGGAVKLLEEFGATVFDVTDSDAIIMGALTHYSARYQTILHNREKALETYAWSAVSAKVVEVYKVTLSHT
jgi:glycosyltransferase involved in cell wall biosynthesis